MNGATKVGALCCAFLLTSCSHPENYRWAEDADVQMPPPAPPPPGKTFQWDSPNVNVYSYATPSPAAVASVGVTSLSDRGQAALIAELAKRPSTADKLTGLLSKPFGSADTPEGQATIDESYSRTLVLTVSEGLEAGPADRLVWTWVDIQPDNFLFDGYTIAATDNETQNIETIQNQTTASLQGQFGMTTSNTNAATNMTAPASATGGTTVGDVLTKVLGTSAGVTGNLSNQYTTSASIAQQYEKLHVDITPRELRVFRGSERNLDVTGNTLVALTMRVNPDLWAKGPHPGNALEEVVQRVSKLTLTKDGKMVEPGKVDIGTSLEVAPPACALTARVTFIYLQRKVDDARSYVEGEQKPQYIQKSVVREGVPLVNSRDVRRPSWRIRAEGEHSDNYVYLAGPFGRNALDFSTYEQAEDFAAWMNQHASWLQRAVSHKIGKNGNWLSWAALGDGSAFPKGKFIADRFPDAATPDTCSGMQLPPP